METEWVRGYNLGHEPLQSYSDFLSITKSSLEETQICNRARTKLYLSSAFSKQIFTEIGDNEADTIVKVVGNVSECVIKRNDLHPVALRRGDGEVKQTQVLAKENPFNVKFKEINSKRAIKETITLEVSVKVESSLHIYWNVNASVLDEFVNESTASSSRDETQSRRDLMQYLKTISNHHKELDPPDFDSKQYEIDVPRHIANSKEEKCTFAVLVMAEITNQLSSQDGNDIVSRILVFDHQTTADSTAGHWILLYDCIGSLNGKHYKLKEVFSCGVPGDDEQEPYECQPGPSSENEETATQYCLVCHTARVTRVLLPCRHACICGNCFKRLTSCPLCRTDIESYFLCHDELALPATQEEIALETSNELSQMSPMELASAIWNAS